MKTVIYKGNTLYHVGKITLRAGVNQVSDADMGYLMAHPHFMQRVNLGIIHVPHLPTLTGKDLTRSIDEVIRIIAKMNDFKVLSSIAQYDNRIEVMQAATKRVDELKKRAASSDILNKHFKGE